MAIVSEHFFIPCAYKAENAEKAIVQLVSRGYKPLIATAKAAYFQGLGIQNQHAPFLRGTEEFEPSMAPPLIGDIFNAQACDAVFYIAIFGDGGGPSRLQIGCFAPDGNAQVANEFRRFRSIVKKSYPNRGKRNWGIYSLVTRRFNDLLKDPKVSFLNADQVATPEQECQILADPDARSWAIRIKAAGGALESDLMRKSPGDPAALQNVISKLESVKLLTREYVVICNKTSNRVNRFDSREQLDHASQIGVKCSCGVAISHERIEQFIGPSVLLSKLLTRSLWMTSLLVTTLKSEGVPSQRIAVNVQEDADEVDAFVDYDASLIMFELKDKEFSMGSAFSFGARLAIHKPEYAIIVATKGVAPEVKRHFERIQPEARLIYVESLENLKDTVSSVIMRIKSESVYKLLSRFEPLTRVQMALGNTLGIRLGLDKEVVGRTSGSFRGQKRYYV